MRTVSRRNFTKALALTALASPFVGAKRGDAQAGAGHAKYLLVFFTNGTAPWLWTPSGSSATNIQFSQMTEPLSAIKENLVIVEKMSSSGTADGHAAPGGLTGLGYGAQNHSSIDAYVADRLAVQGVQTPIPNVVLGGVGTEQQTSFFKGGQVISPIFSPLTAFDAIFGASVGSTSPEGPGPEVLERRRKAALDLAKQELDQIQADLGPNESLKVELHKDSIAQLEELLGGDFGGGAGCQDITSPTDGGQDLLNSALHLDMAISAFGCGMTRVAAVQFGHHQSTQVDLPPGIVGDWHNSILHNIGNAEQQLIDLERWLCERFVDAAEKLKATPDPDGIGTLFDNTLMVWARDMGDAVNHAGDDMRFVFAGGAGGYLKTSPNGVYIDASGEPHQRALCSIADAMGVDDLGGFGDSGISKAPLSAIGGA